MSYLSSIESFDQLDYAFFNGLNTISKSSDGSLKVFDSETNVLVSFDVTSGTPIVLETESLSAGGMTTVGIGGSNFSISSAQLDLVMSDPGGSSHSATLGLYGYNTNHAQLMSVEVGGTLFLLSGLEDASGLTVTQQLPDLSLGSPDIFLGSHEANLQSVSSMVSFEIGAVTYVAVASHEDDGLTLMSIDGSGTLTELDAYSANEGLPVNTPTDLMVVEVDGKPLILLSSYSGSLTVLEVDGSDQLSVVDHVLDTNYSRFDSAIAVDAITYNGCPFVAVGGGDNGISLFKILPDGTLFLVDTYVGTNVTDLVFVETGGGLELMALTSGSADATGIERFVVDVSDVGAHGTGIAHTSEDDVIAAVNGGGSLSGGAGDDVLIDGLGVDRMTGGSGQDTFQFKADGQDDYITDFNYLEDKIDLSHFDFAGSVNSLSITYTASGFSITFGGETLHVTTYNGLPPPTSILVDSLFFNTDHVDIGERINNFEGDMIEGDGSANVFVGTSKSDTLYGFSGADVFFYSGGADVFDGGTDVDLVDYSAAQTSVVVDLSTGLNFGAAEGDTLVNIENLAGTDFGDTLRGDEYANTLLGNAGTDTLYGREGDDVLVGGLGADTLYGGEGADTVSYQYSSVGVTVDLADSTNNFGGDATGDVFFDIENILGSDLPDLLYGDDGDNHIYARLGNDEIYAGAGNDIVVASHGNDVIFAGDGIDIVNGGDGNDILKGGLGNDRLVGADGNDNISNISGIGSLIGGSGEDFIHDGLGSSGINGGSGDDRLVANGGHDLVLGENGDDVINGGAGNDRITGGAGNDYIVGGAGNDIFVFRIASERDRIADFKLGQDRLFIEYAAANNASSVQQIVDDYAYVSGNDLIFDFGDGREIVLYDFTDIDNIADSMLIV